MLGLEEQERIAAIVKTFRERKSKDSKAKITTLHVTRHRVVTQILEVRKLSKMGVP